jgi:3-deoxy-7-phosphoheptulonate synthase
VDTPAHVEIMMKALRDNGQVCTRMGAYKPRTSPYAFQGHGKACLPWVFELAGKYGIKVIAMEVTHESHVNEIHECLEQTGQPTGVMLQIGTRNAQNFFLLEEVGRTGKPEDLVGPAIFLASDLAGFVTGAILMADGGYLTV